MCNTSSRGCSILCPGQAGVNYALRVERELHALAGGAWDGSGSSAHRAAWALRVRGPCAAYPRLRGQWRRLVCL